MPYIGHSPEVAQRRYEAVDDISGSFNGSTTSFALQVGGVTPAPFPVASENVLISVGGVIQEPDGGGTNGFQLTGTNIVFSSAPASGQSFFGVILAGADYVTAGHAFPDGDLASPSVTFASDLDTGLFRPDSGALAFGGNGSEYARLDGSGRLLVGNPTARTNVVDGDGGNTLTPQFQFETANDDTTKGLSVIFGRNNSNGAEIVLGKHRNASVGGTTIVNDGDQLGSLTFSGSDGTNFRPGATIEANVDATPGSSDMPGRLVFSTTADGAAVPTERVRIDSSGRLLINTTSAITTASGANLQIRATSEAPQIILGRNDSTATTGETLGILSWYGNDGGSYQECASIRGVVDADHAHDDKPTRISFYVARDNSGSITESWRLRSDGGTQNFSTSTNYDLSNTRAAGTTYEFFYARNNAGSLGAGTLAFRVTNNGNVTNTNNSYGSLSDQRLKENIVDATSQWDDIKGLQIRKYNFRENTGYETHTQIGLIAQEAESISPGLVETSAVKEGETVLDADGNQLESIKSINYSVLYMKAVKALQEAQTRIESLETQNTAQQTTIGALETQNTAQQTTIDDLLARVTALEAA